MVRCVWREVRRCRRKRKRRAQRACVYLYMLSTSTVSCFFYQKKVIELLEMSLYKAMLQNEVPCLYHCFVPCYVYK